MTEFSGLMGSMTQATDGWAITVSEDWLQGRTVYGGLSAALCLEAAHRQFGDLPPLRSAQISFIGPATGALKLTPVELRKGKSTVFVGVDLFGESGLATRATFCFGAGRASKVAFAAKAAAQINKPESCPAFFDNAPPPAIVAMLTAPGLISTMTWSIDLLTDTIDTTDGWWLIRTKADAAADGYTSQVMTIWNAAGQAVMTSRQNVAVFG
jgi:acyl-CoA thioesterase